jgi:hypothetical protein
MSFGHGTFSACIKLIKKRSGGRPCSQVKCSLYILPHVCSLMTTLPAGPTDQDDDFSWEDEDEDAAPKAEAPLPPTLTVPAPNRLVATDASGMMSPQRSDDSFDLVSSGHTSAAGDANAVHINEEGTSDGDEDEEDEDEEENEDEDEDDGEEESDWE